MSCFALYYLHFVSFSKQSDFLLGRFRLKEFTLGRDSSQCTLLLEGHMGELFSSAEKLVELSHAKMMVEQPLCFKKLATSEVCTFLPFSLVCIDVEDGEAHRPLQLVCAPSLSPRGLYPSSFLCYLQNFETLSVWSTEAWPLDVNSSLVYL